MRPAFLLLILAIGCAAPRPPNIVLVVVDDLGWQDTSVSFTPEPTPLNRRWRTPHLERLAAQGMRFTDAYASAPVCTPSRTALLTGSAPARTHITYWTLRRDQDTSSSHPTLAPPEWNVNGLQPGARTLPSVLGSTGYRTIHVGKAHFGAVGSPGADPLQLGFELNIAGHGAGGPGSHSGLHAFTESGRKGSTRQLPSIWDVPGLERYHGQDIFLEEALAIEAVALIDRAASEQRPFFLHFAPYSVHAPIMANQRYLEHYPDLDPIEAAYGTMIESVDAALGALLDALERNDLSENTLVLFTSDNGGLSAHARGRAPDGSTSHHHNAPLRSGKGSAYEGGLRVPLVAHWPVVTTPGAISHEPVILADLFPTLLAAAGADDSSALDGVDLGPLFAGGELPGGERDLVWHQPHDWGVPGPGIEPFSALRRGRWKLIFFHAGPRFELYEVEQDPGEQHDLARERPELASVLVRALDEALGAMGAQLSIDKASGLPIERPTAAWIRFAAND